MGFEHGVVLSTKIRQNSNLSKRGARPRRTLGRRDIFFKKSSPQQLEPRAEVAPIVRLLDETLLYNRNTESLRVAGYWRSRETFHGTCSTKHEAFFRRAMHAPFQSSHPPRHHLSTFGVAGFDETLDMCPSRPDFQTYSYCVLLVTHRTEPTEHFSFPPPTFLLKMKLYDRPSQ